MPKRPDPTPPNPIDDILGLLGRVANDASAGANAVVRRAQGKPLFTDATNRQDSGNIINDTLTHIVDSVVNGGNDFVQGVANADRARGHSYSGKRNGRNADQLGVSPSGGNWHHPEEEAGLSGVMNDAKRRFNAGRNAVDMAIVEPAKRKLAPMAAKILNDVMEGYHNQKTKKDERNLRNYGTKNVEEPNIIEQYITNHEKNKKQNANDHIKNWMTVEEHWTPQLTHITNTTYARRKTPAYPSGGNWFDPESEAGLEGIITNAKRGINSLRNGNTKKRGSVQKANFGEMLANAGRAVGRMGEMGGRLKGFGERIGRGLTNMYPMAGEEMSALTRQGLAGTPQEYLRRNSRPPIDVNSQAGINDYLQRMGKQFDVEREVMPMARSPFTDSEMEFRRLDPELEPTKTNAFYQGYRVGKPKSPTSRGYRGIGGITSDLKNKRINDFNNYMEQVAYLQRLSAERAASKAAKEAEFGYRYTDGSEPDYPLHTYSPEELSQMGFPVKKSMSKRAKKEPICDCGEPISQCKCSDHNHKSMQKGGMCKCGSGMSKSMCKCGSGMGKSMYKSMSGKMDADMAITPQKISTNRSIKSSNKYFD